VARIFDNLGTLQKLIQRKPFGLITDMDGTISPIPHDFLRKTIPPPTLPQLTELVSRMDLLAIVSGRTSEAIKNLVNIDGIKYSGHYGMEQWENDRAILHPDAGAYVPAMRAVAEELEALRSIQGILIQYKGATISVHYHLCLQPEAAKQQILNLLMKSTQIKNLLIMDEKTNIGIVPRVDIDKGTAVTTLIQQYHLGAAIYMGDDIGDIPAFRAVRRAKSKKDFDGLAILVTGTETSHSLMDEVDFTLDGVTETETLLNWLIDNTRGRT
jgi:trehalose 6-phosphate phosphatase